MPYSSDEIKVIHQQALAEADRRYAGIDGKTYIGTSGGRLRIIDDSVLDLERELDDAKAELTEAIQEAKDSLEEVIEDITTEGGSYVELDINLDVMPKENIEQILSLNILELDTFSGELFPSEIGVEDILLEINGTNEITIKDF
jgi:chemotaxis regulatin CheY-phosphate phosphatase CheZ